MTPPLAHVAIAVVTIALLLLAIGDPAGAATFTVDTTTDTSDVNPGDGICADAVANCSLRAAIEESNASAGADVITVPAGTYTIGSRLDITSDVTVNGAGATSTTVDGNGVATDVFRVSGTSSPSVELTGMTIRGAANFSGVNLGAGTTTISNSTITANQGLMGGGVLVGAVDSQNTSATVTNSTITGNNASGMGGGIAVAEGNPGFTRSLTVTGSIITNNTADSDGNMSGVGGGIAAVNSPITVTNTTVSGNTATDGGGLSVAGGTLTMTGGSVSNNSVALAAGGGLDITGGAVANITGTAISGQFAPTGGGIHVLGSTLTLTGTTISGNSAGGAGAGGGGIAVRAGATATANTSTITANTSSGNGGGVVITDGATFSATDSTISANMADLGAGIHGSGENPGPGGPTVTLTNTTVTGNTATNNGDGGGILIDNSGGNGSSTLTITGGEVTSNSALVGGGIHASEVNVVVSGTSIGSNTADASGGGVLVKRGSLTMTGATVTSNKTGSISGTGGGGVFASESAKIVIDTSTFSGNTVPTAGGGLFSILNSFGSLAITNSTFSGNTAGDGAGALHLSGPGSTSTLTNVTVNGNGNDSATFAAGVTAPSGTTNVVQSTIAANSNAKAGGGGLRVASGSVGSSIVAANASPGSPDCAGSISSAGHNVIGDGTGCTLAGGTGDQVGTGAAPIDPKLGPLQNNGGKVQTRALLQSSPAINSVPPASCGATVDARGESRPQGTACDAGSYEAKAATAVNDSYSFTLPGSLSIAAPGVLGNDTDPEGDSLTTMVATTTPNGTLALAADGSFTYTPNPGFAGTDVFTYRANDATGSSNLATVSITVNAAPPPPPPPPPLVAPTVGLVDPAQGQWHLRNSAGQVTSFFFGNPGDVPLMGDWDCDGDDTPGMYRQSDGFVYVRNSNSSGVADSQFFLGNPGDQPIAGDFNNNGCDTVSIYRPSEQRFYIANTLAANNAGIVADFSFIFGNPGDKPVVGDWDGDGTDEVGLHRESTGFFYWRNTLDQGVASGQIFFGDPADRFVAGDWGTVDGIDTPAVFRPSNATFFFRHTLTQGNADSQFAFGEGPWLPVAGRFGLG